MLAMIAGWMLAGCIVGWLAEAAFGGWLIPPRWSIIIGIVVGTMIGRFMAMWSADPDLL